MKKVVLLRPFPLAKTLRALSRDRHRQAVERLLDGDRDGWSVLRKDAERIDREASAAERWEAECELTRAATEAILERSK